MSLDIKPYTPTSGGVMNLDLGAQDYSFDLKTQRTDAKGTKSQPRSTTSDSLATTIRDILAFTLEIVKAFTSQNATKTPATTASPTDSTVTGAAPTDPASSTSSPAQPATETTPASQLKEVLSKFVEQLQNIATLLSKLIEGSTKPKAKKSKSFLGGLVDKAKNFITGEVKDAVKPKNLLKMFGF